jgi:hypothetical protein
MGASAYAAGLVAGAISLFELFNASRKPPCRRAFLWILVLFGFDAASGLIAYALLAEALKGLTWFTGPWPVLLAGLCGPALLRSQLALLGSGQESSYYGPAVRYRRVQKGIERKIDQINAAQQSEWIVTKVLPCLESISIQELDIQVTNYVKAVDGITSDERTEILDYVSETIADVLLDDTSKRRAIAQKMIDSDSREFVKNLSRRGAKLGPPRPNNSVVKAFKKG